MARYSAAFVWAALTYFTVGMFLGVAVAIEPTWMGQLRTAHAHLNLLGWVSMFIFGVAYHVLPRFTGQPLHSPLLADVHVVTANVGLVGMVLGFALFGPSPFVAVFGTVELVGNLLFVYNVARTLLAARSASTPAIVPFAGRAR